MRNAYSKEKLDGVIGERLRSLRKGHGWTQENMGGILNMDARSVRRYEDGHAIPSHVLAIYARTFCVPADYLLFGTDSDVICKKQLIEYIKAN